MEVRSSIDLKTPIKEEDVRKLKIGDIVTITGEIICARDMAHKYYFENIDKKITPSFENAIIYHCGPLAEKTKNGYNIISAGPTTSIRMSRYLPALIEKYKIKLIIGKGGLDKSILPVLSKFGCVYLSIIGGLGATIADKIIKVEDVSFLEFGMAEAVWKLLALKMPAIVTMDTHNKSMHEKILEDSIINSKKLAESGE
jgi:fumarate hydratase class I